MFLSVIALFCSFVHVLTKGILLVMADGNCVATVSHDRTIKLWCSNNSEQDHAMDVD